MPNPEKSAAYTRLTLFIKEQGNHWKRLRNGKIPETNIINGWIESCDFAEDDLKLLAKNER